MLGRAMPPALAIGGRRITSRNFLRTSHPAERRSSAPIIPISHAKPVPYGRNWSSFPPRDAKWITAPAYVVPAGEDKGLFRLWLDGVSIDVEAPFRGAFGAENVIAVAAVAHRLGLGAEEIAAGFAGAALPKQRFACSSGPGIGWSSTTATTPTRCLFPGCWRPPLKWPGITRTGPLCACSAKWVNWFAFRG